MVLPAATGRQSRRGSAARRRRGMWAVRCRRRRCLRNARTWAAASPPPAAQIDNMSRRCNGPDSRLKVKLRGAATVSGCCLQACKLVVAALATSTCFDIGARMPPRCTMSRTWPNSGLPCWLSGLLGGPAPALPFCVGGPCSRWPAGVQPPRSCAAALQQPGNTIEADCDWQAQLNDG